MPLYVKDGGVWKPVTPYVRDGGTWKPFSPSVRDGGTWKSPGSGGLLVVGQDSQGRYGWVSGGAYGNLSPQPLYVAGYRVTTIETDLTVPDDLTLIIDGSFLPSTLFTSVQIEDGTGSVRTYSASSASFSSDASSAVWKWGSGSSPVYSSADVGESHAVTFIF